MKLKKPIFAATLAALAAVPVSAAAAPPYAIETLETWVGAPNGNQLYVRLVRPVPALCPGQRFPALVAIPGGTGAGAPLADNPGYRNLAGSGFVVVVFNAEGRGSGLPGNLRSEGTENCNGYAHQDDLKAIVEYTASLPNVDPANIGVETASFGIAIGAGALGRYPSLRVAYLLDQEGPHDNLVITFYDAGRETAVCGHLSTVTDPSAENAAFWAEREAFRYIGTYPGRYLRMQAEVDHAQNPGYFRHAIEMINAATRSAFGGAGAACWTRMNGSDIGNPIDAIYPLDDPSQYLAWVSGRLSDHPGLNLTYAREMSALVAGGGTGCAKVSLLAGKTLLVRDDAANPARRKIVFVSRDPMVLPPDRGAAGDPTSVGGALELLNPATGEAASFSLAAENWRGLGAPAGSGGYRYSDPWLSRGPCKRVELREGKLKARCRGSQISFTLDEESQGSLGVRPTAGGSEYCMLFGGTIVKDTRGLFEAREAPQPASCPGVPQGAQLFTARPR